MEGGGSGSHTPGRRCQLSRWAHLTWTEVGPGSARMAFLRRTGFPSRTAVHYYETSPGPMGDFRLRARCAAGKADQAQAKVDKEHVRLTVPVHSGATLTMALVK